ncbi:MAG: type II and III secretion system protein [Crocinitomicaceae bacterium]|nr:type II and III secretion system protein [Crocinitomicaceae bacterium]
MKINILICILFFCFASVNSFAQEYSETTLRIKLDELSANHKGLNNTLQLNVSSLQLSELVNSIALENNLNISVDPTLNQLITYNFFDAQVKDVLVFLYLNFEIEYEFIGSIISIEKRAAEKIPDVVTPPRKIDIKYNTANTFLSLNLKNDTLWKVTQEITKASGLNFVVDPDIRSNAVNAYLLNRPIEEVLNMFVKSNGLLLTKEDDYYRLSKGEPIATVAERSRNSPNYSPSSKNGDFVLTKNDVGTIDVFARNVDLAQLIQAAADETGVHYVVYTPLQGKVNLDVQDVRFDDLVDMVFTGSEYSMRNDDDIYIIGENKSETFRVSELIRLENRTIESVKTAIPKDMLAGIEVLEFEELNGLIVTGTKNKIEALKSFISMIDIVVPMVQIDVMILYSARSSNLSMGIKAGVKDAPTTTSGTVFPGVDMDLGAQSINNILNAISGFGFVNLGQVTENFYVSINALEDNGIVEVESTPKISTLNGHEATISIGQQVYYQENQITVQSSAINQGTTQSRTFKAVNADLSVTIKPFVSADEYVTLTISVQQDDFTPPSEIGAPPGKSTQNFESMIRVKNGELILLGGLEKKENSNAGAGVPFLSKIPILKWFFSSREKKKSKSKMHILIRPVVTY